MNRKRPGPGLKIPLLKPEIAQPVWVFRIGYFQKKIRVLSLTLSLMTDKDSEVT